MGEIDYWGNEHQHQPHAGPEDHEEARSLRPAGILAVRVVGPRDKALVLDTHRRSMLRLQGSRTAPPISLPASCGPGRLPPEPPDRDQGAHGAPGQQRRKVAPGKAPPGRVRAERATKRLYHVPEGKDIGDVPQP